MQHEGHGFGRLLVRCHLQHVQTTHLVRESVAEIGRVGLQFQSDLRLLQIEIRLDCIRLEDALLRLYPLPEHLLVCRLPDDLLYIWINLELAKVNLLALMARSGTSRLRIP